MEQDRTPSILPNTEGCNGRSLIQHEAIVQLIGGGRTSAGPSVKSKLDVRAYQAGITVSNAKVDQLDSAAFRGEWNYTIKPSRPRSRWSSSCFWSRTKA
jgi:hypothetical protein